MCRDCPELGSLFISWAQVSDQSDGAGVVLSLESKDSFVLQAAHDKLKSLLPSGCVISEEVDMQDSDKMLNK
jgi:hypothetical protein